MHGPFIATLLGAHAHGNPKIYKLAGLEARDQRCQPCCVGLLVGGLPLPALRCRCDDDDGGAQPPRLRAGDPAAEPRSLMYPGVAFLFSAAAAAGAPRFDELSRDRLATGAAACLVREFAADDDDDTGGRARVGVLVFLDDGRVLEEIEGAGCAAAATIPD